ncbi:MAG TPA: PilN domain-containing protein [Ramlibacter sp.]
MILINLLPHREAARKRRREMFYAALGASAFAGAMIAGGIYLWYAAQISDQQNRNLVLTTEIKKLEAQIKDIATLQEEIAALRARQQAVEDLQSDRNVPVHLLNELVKQLPDGVYLTSMRQTNNVVAVTGVAQSNERVSELLRNLSGGSVWITRPELVEIVASNVAISARDQRRVANFSMRMTLLRASEAQKAAAAAASAAASAAAAAPASAAVATAGPAGTAVMPMPIAPPASAKK